MGIICSCMGDRSTDYPRDWKSVERYVPKPKSGLCIKVYDGDTITILSKYNKRMYKFSVRIRGVDTPELRGSSKEEKKLAMLARNATARMCIGKELTLCNHGTDKYGRVLADVYVGKMCVKSELIKNGHGVSYSGGKKVRWAI